MTDILYPTGWRMKPVPITRTEWIKSIGINTVYERLRSNPMEPDIQMVLERAGVFHKAMSPTAIRMVTTFYRRPWTGKCTLDDICLLGAQYGVDTKPLIEMAEAAGELDGV